MLVGRAGTSGSWFPVGATDTLYHALGDADVVIDVEDYYH